MLQGPARCTGWHFGTDPCAAVGVCDPPPLWSQLPKGQVFLEFGVKTPLDRNGRCTVSLGPTLNRRSACV